MNARQAQPVPRRESTAQELLDAARFGVPEPLPSHVSRPRLLHALDAAEQLPLIVVSGPAGSGKTSLLGEWVRSRRARSAATAWVTFEDGDSSFWSCVLESLTRRGAETAVTADATGSDPLLGRQRLRSLAVSLSQQERRWTVVVDGYEMSDLDLAGEVDYLLRHTFGRLQMVFSGRVDPVLPLYRYRLDDTVAEVRAADLAFTDEEAERLLEEMGVGLASAAAADLNARVKGWVAGLRFAGRALLGREAPAEAVLDVVAQAGDINQYLLGEVLDVQLPEIRQFMLDASVPDLLVPDLLTTLIGDRAPHLLEDVARANAFIEPLPGQPGSHRYYPFFRDLLRAQLAYEDPVRMRRLHHRAAEWYLRSGLVDRSLVHLAAVGAWDEVTEQVVRRGLVGRILLEGPDTTLGRVAAEVPSEVGPPPAALVRAAVALARGDRIACGDEVAAARRTMVGQGESTDALDVSLSVVDAVRSSLADDVDTAAALVADARRRLGTNGGRSRPEAEAAMYALVQLSAGITMLRRGDLSRARTALTIAVGLEAAHRYAAFRADCLGYLALLDAVEGNLARARRAAEESSAAAEEAGAGAAARSPAAELALACVALEQYELEAAREHLDTAVGARAIAGDPVSRTLVDGVIAGLDRAAGRLQSAVARLEEAATRADGPDPWLAVRLRVEAARLAVAGGHPEQALRELEPVELLGDVDAAVVAAVAHVELGDKRAADEILARVGEGQPHLVVQVTALVAEAAQEARRRSRGRARLLLEQALRLAEPELLRRPFRESGAVVQRMLAGDPQLLAQHAWLPRATDAGAAGRATGRPPTAEGRSRPAVVESLTPKELEVLGHLEELLTTEEIAEKMFVSVNTVRTHVRSILRKLGVTRRNAAVRRARELGIFVG